MASVEVNAEPFYSELTLFAEMLSPSHMAELLGTQGTELIRKRNQARFTGEGDDVSGAWAPLSDATVQIREDMGYPGEHPINVRSGSLEQYITNSPSSMMVSATSARLTYPASRATGDMLDKLMVAQQGDPIKGTPARPVLGFNQNDLLSVMTMIMLDLESSSIMDLV